MKITTDGALNLADGRGGAGGIARSPTALLGAWCKLYVGISDPLIMEGLSLRDGVRFASLHGFSHVIMEVDCLELVTLWTTRHNYRSIVALLLLEIGELSVHFFSFIISTPNGAVGRIASTVYFRLVIFRLVYFRPVYFRLISHHHISSH